MRVGKIILICLLISGLSIFVLAKQSFGFGANLNLAANYGLDGLTIDIPANGNWDPQLVFWLNTTNTNLFKVGVKINRDMGEAYNIKRYLGGGIGIFRDWSSNVRFGIQTQVGIKVPAIVDGYFANLEVGFNLNRSNNGRINGGALIGAGLSYSF